MFEMMSLGSSSEDLYLLEVDDDVMTDVKVIKLRPVSSSWPTLTQSRANA